VVVTAPRLEEVRPGGKASWFAQAAAGTEKDTFFLALRGGVQAPEEGLAAGDLLAVSGTADAEPGDLVVWWRGSASTQALARVDEEQRLQPVAGFPAPPLKTAGEGTPPPGRRRRVPPHTVSLRGVVVGRLRRLPE